MPRWRFEFAQMGCPCELVLDADDEPRARDAARAAVAEVARLDRKYSHYRDDSVLGELARDAGARAVEVDDETAALLDVAAALHRDTGGRYDATAAPLTALWDFRRAALPDAGEIEAARARVGWHRVAWHRPLLRLQPGMSLDFGAIAKEYAADRAAAVLRAHGVVHGLVSLGGDVAVAGPAADGAPWRIGVSDPSAPARALRTVPLDAGGFATSGDYARSRIVGGRRYGHVVDVARGEPVTAPPSVSVAAPSCLVAGALATAALLAGLDGAERLLAESGLPWLCIALDGRTSGPLAGG
jgi:thiamine biosynthesis lipoprotein